MSVEILSTDAQLYKKSHLKGLQQEMTLGSLKIIGIVSIQWAIYHFLLVVADRHAMYAQYLCRLSTIIWLFYESIFVLWCSSRPHCCCRCIECCCQLG